MLNLIYINPYADKNISSFLEALRSKGYKGSLDLDDGMNDYLKLVTCYESTLLQTSRPDQTTHRVGLGILFYLFFCLSFLSHHGITQPLNSERPKIIDPSLFFPSTADGGIEGCGLSRV